MLCDYYESAVGKYLSLSSSRLLNASALQARFLKKQKQKNRNKKPPKLLLFLSTTSVKQVGVVNFYTELHLFQTPVLHAQAKPACWSGLASVSTPSDPSACIGFLS